MAKRIIALLALCACEDHRVSILAGSDTKIEATTRDISNASHGIAITVHQPVVKIPVLIPMPMPYERVTAERAER